MIMVPVQCEVLDGHRDAFRRAQSIGEESGPILSPKKQLHRPCGGLARGIFGPSPSITPDYFAALPVWWAVATFSDP